MNHERPTCVPKRLILVSLLLAAVFQMVAVAINAQDDRSVRTPTAGYVLNSLTEEERAWLRDHPVIRVAHDPEWPPIEFSNERGELSGMSGDYLSLVEQRLGVTFERVRNLTWQEVYARQKRWEIDVATCVAATPPRLEFWAFTKPFLRVPIVIATQSDVTYIAEMKELFGKRVALVEGYAIDDWVTRDFPEISLTRVKAPQEGLAMLQRGEIFAYIDNLLIIGYYQARLKATHLKIAGETPYVNAQSMAVRKDWAILAGILDKALDSISQAERNDIYRKWLPLRYEHGFDYTPLWWALGVFAAILLALMLWNWKLAREIMSRRLAEEALRKSEAQNRALISATTDLIFTNRGDGEFLAVEASDVNALFIPPEAFLHRKVQEVLPRAIAERFLKAFADALASGAVQEVSYVLPMGGQERHFEARVVPATGDKLISTVRDVTERKQSEEALRQANLVVENSPVVLFRWRAAEGWPVEMVSRNVSQFGFTPEELLSGAVPFASIVHPEDLDRIAREVREYTASGTERFQQEYRIVTRDGGVRWVDDRTVVERNIEGQIVLYQGIVIDVTERKQAEMALRESEKRFRILAEASFEGIAITEQGVVLDCNEQLARMLGHQRAELLGRSAREFIAPEHRDLVAEARQTERVEPYEHMMLHRDGTRFPVEVAARLAQIQGRQVRITAVRDITERKRAEEKLAQSHNLMRYVIEHNNSAVAVHDRDLRYVYVSQRYLDDYKVKERDVIGKHHYDVFPDLPRKWRDVHQRALAGEISSADRDPYHRADGTIDWTRWECRPWYEADGVIGGIIVYTELITERMRAEAALRKSLLEKESLLKEVHHRVKNNLQVISSLLKLQARRVQNPEVRGFLLDTQNRVRSMALLHETLYRSGNLATVNVPQYVKNVCAHTARSYASNAESIRLRHDIANVALDLDRAIPAGLIISELVSNAFKHAFPSRSEGEILVELLTAPEQQLVLRVSDNGTGLPAESDPQNAETLGLLLVRNLTRQLDGRMSVTSGQGTVFEIVFPG